MRAHAFPYLATLETREQCLHAKPPVFETGWRANRAILLHSLGRKAEAAQLLTEDLERACASGASIYADTLRNVAERLGMAIGGN